MTARCEVAGASNVLDFDVSESEEVVLSRVLDVDERRRGHAKFRMTVRMSIRQVCNILDEVSVRRRNRFVGIYYCAYHRGFRVCPVTRKGYFRRRERLFKRDHCSRATRRYREERRRSGERFDWKTTQRSIAEFRRQCRRIYKESLSCVAPELEQRDIPDSDYLDIVELRASLPTG